MWICLGVCSWHHAPDPRAQRTSHTTQCRGGVTFSTHVQWGCHSPQTWLAGDWQQPPAQSWAHIESVQPKYSLTSQCAREPKHSVTLTECKTARTQCDLLSMPEIWCTLKHSVTLPILMAEVPYLCWQAFGWGGWSPYLASQSVTTIPWVPEEKKERK